MEANLRLGDFNPGAWARRARERRYARFPRLTEPGRPRWWSYIARTAAMISLAPLAIWYLEYVVLILHNANFALLTLEQRTSSGPAPRCAPSAASADVGVPNGTPPRRRAGNDVICRVYRASAGRGPASRRPGRAARERRWGPCVSGVVLPPVRGSLKLGNARRVSLSLSRARTHTRAAAAPSGQAHAQARVGVRHRVEQVSSPAGQSPRPLRFCAGRADRRQWYGRRVDCARRWAGVASAGTRAAGRACLVCGRTDPPSCGRNRRHPPTRAPPDRPVAPHPLPHTDSLQLGLHYSEHQHLCPPRSPAQPAGRLDRNSLLQIPDRGAAGAPAAPDGPPGAAVAPAR